MLLETDDCTSSVPTWYRKNGVWSLIMAWWRHEESLALRWLKNGTLCWHITSVASSICRRVGGHIHWENLFFWRRGISFGFGQFVSLSTEAIFSFNFWEAPSIVSLGRSQKWLHFWDQILASSLEPKSVFFLEFVASNSPIGLSWKRQDASRESCRCSAVVLTSNDSGS